jgi:hypothetical protein
MLERLDIPIVGDHGLVTGKEEVSGKSVLHVDEVPQMADPFQRLLQNDLHPLTPSVGKEKRILEGLEKSQS